MFNENGDRITNISLDQKEIQYLQNDWKDFIKNTDKYPEKNFHGRGIVICAGGINYFTCVWITIKVIRNINQDIPIQIWYKENELSDLVIKKLENLSNLKCIKFEATDIAERKIGYQLKSLAILKSSFEEVIYLDADNIPLIDPEVLFNSKWYQDLGAIFWPDFWHTPSNNPIWDILNLKYLKTKEQESGQLVINKKKCWEAINLCDYFNLNGHIYYKLLFGDKDTFRFAFMAVRTSFHMIEKEPSTCGYLDINEKFRGISMLQYFEDNNPIFLHRNLLKWYQTKNEEFVFKYIKSFTEGNDIRKYINRFSQTNGHYYMDLAGDIEFYKCNNKIEKLESNCMNYLISLRTSDFYREFLVQAIINSSRPRTFSG